jgi:hypothetical protein
MPMPQRHHVQLIDDADIIALQVLVLRDDVPGSPALRAGRMTPGSESRGTKFLRNQNMPAFDVLLHLLAREEAHHVRVHLLQRINEWHVVHCRNANRNRTARLGLGKNCKFVIHDSFSRKFTAETLRTQRKTDC